MSDFDCISEKEYLMHVEKFLSELSEQLEEIMDENSFIEDVEYSSGVLKLELSNGKIYVLNK